MIKTIDQVSPFIWQVHEKIREAALDVQCGFLLLGQHLFEFCEQDGPQKMGYASFNEYISDPEIPLSVGTAYRARDNFAFFAYDYELPIDRNGLLARVGVTKLDFLRSRILNRNLSRGEVIDWLELAAANTQNALEMELIDAFGGEPEMDANFENPIQAGSASGLMRNALSELLAHHLDVCPDCDNMAVRKARGILLDS